MEKTFETWKVLQHRGGDDGRRSKVLPEAAHLIRQVRDQPTERVVELVRVSPFELGMRASGMGRARFTHEEVCQAALAAGLRLCHPRIGFWLAGQWALDTSYTVLGMDPVMTWFGGWADHESSVLEFQLAHTGSWEKRVDVSVLTASRVNLGNDSIYTEHNPFIFRK